MNIFVSKLRMTICLAATILQVAESVQGDGVSDLVDVAETDVLRDTIVKMIMNTEEERSLSDVFDFLLRTPDEPNALALCRQNCPTRSGTCVKSTHGYKCIKKLLEEGSFGRVPMTFAEAEALDKCRRNCPNRRAECRKSGRAYKCLRIARLPAVVQPHSDNTAWSKIDQNEALSYCLANCPSDRAACKPSVHGYKCVRKNVVFVDTPASTGGSHSDEEPNALAQCLSNCPADKATCKKSTHGYRCVRNNVVFVDHVPGSRLNAVLMPPSHQTTTAPVSLPPSSTQWEALSLCRSRCPSHRAACKKSTHGYKCVSLRDNLTVVGRSSPSLDDITPYSAAEGSLHSYRFQCVLSSRVGLPMPEWCSPEDLIDPMTDTFVGSEDYWVQDEEVDHFSLGYRDNDNVFDENKAQDSVEMAVKESTNDEVQELSLPCSSFLEAESDQPTPCGELKSTAVDLETW